MRENHIPGILLGLETGEQDGTVHLENPDSDEEYREGKTITANVQAAVGAKGRPILGLQGPGKVSS